MNKIIFLLALVPTFGHAAPNQRMNLHFEYSHGERASCRTDLTVDAGEEYVACEIRIDGKQTFLRVRVDPQPKRQYLFALRVEMVEPDGRIKIVSNPQIMAFQGEAAKMWMGDKGRPETYEDLSATVTRE